MAAYAALVSLMHIIEQIQHHPCPPFYLDNKHTQCLIENVTFLQNFLELYSHVRNEQVDSLERSIAEAAYAAEDLIETHVVDQILAQSRRHGKRISSVDFYEDLQRVTQDVDLIKKEVMEIKEKMGSDQDIPQHRRSSTPADSLSRSHSMGQNMIVGLDDILNQLMDKLTRQRSYRQVIPIVGMGGIGKTTLVRNVYENQLIVEHFDIRGWVTISQEYSAKDILSQLLRQSNLQSLGQMSTEELGEKVYKYLFDRRYLIILDDMWSTETWDEIKKFFPSNENYGSGMVVTSRLSNLALHVCGAPGLKMNFLNENISWNLFCKIVFGSEYYCPFELEKIGKNIVENCKGLPLAIVVIGGLLAKSEKTSEYWKYIAENFSSMVNLDDNERCLKLLYLSYNHLPIHLKSCFLYMSVYPKDFKIYVPDLIKLWVAEGFLKSISGKTLEETAQEYLRELTDRNVILIKEWGSSGNIKSITIHDLLRDLCLREAEKNNFLCLTRQPNLFVRRFAIHQRTLEKEGFLDDLQSSSIARSLICDEMKVSLSPSFRLLRVLKAKYLEAAISPQVNLRYLAAAIGWKVKFPFASHIFWNLQTLIVTYIDGDTIEIWKMPQLRHVKIFNLRLMNPSDGQNDSVLKNLQTLSYVNDFTCSKKMVKRIPGIKQLKIVYHNRFIGSRYCLNNLARLHNLESLNCVFSSSGSDLLQNITFPHSLKKLTFEGSRFYWEDISTKIGPLPLLEVLKLKQNSFRGPEWKTVEGQFCSLKYLEIKECDDLEYWETENTHFPRLQHLHLGFLNKLKEIPRDIGEIATLRLIELHQCSNSAVISAEEIVEEQAELGNEDLKVRIPGGSVPKLTRANL